MASNTSSIKGKTVAVTGATSGIGRDVVSVLAAAGAKVVFSGRRNDKGQALEDELKGKKLEATFVQGDVTKLEDVQKLVKTAELKYGGLDVLINNAGVDGEMAALSEQGALDNFDKVFDVNVKGILRGYQAATPLLKKGTNALVINISSVVSVFPFPRFGVYSASKAAVDAVTRVAAAELEADKIRVLSLNPYVFHSEMADRASSGNPEVFAQAFNPSGKAGRGTDLGQYVVELYEGKHDKQYPSGSQIFIENGNANWTASEVLPKYLALQQQQKAAAAAAAAAGKA